MVFHHHGGSSLALQPFDTLANAVPDLLVVQYVRGTT